MKMLPRLVLIEVVLRSCRGQQAWVIVISLLLCRVLVDLIVVVLDVVVVFQVVGRRWFVGSSAG